MDGYSQATMTSLLLSRSERNGGWKKRGDELWCRARDERRSWEEEEGKRECVDGGVEEEKRERKRKEERKRRGGSETKGLWLETVCV